MPSCCYKPVWITLSWWSNNLKNVGNQAVDGSHWLPLYEKNYRSRWLPSTVWFPTFFKISSIVFNRRDKLLQVWNNMRESKLWHHFHFCMNYPFKRHTITQYEFGHKVKKSLGAYKSVKTNASLHLIRCPLNDQKSSFLKTLRLFVTRTLMEHSVLHFTNILGMILLNVLWTF